MQRARYTVITIAGGDVTTLLENFLAQHSSILDAPLHVFCLDDAMLSTCHRLSHSQPPSTFRQMLRCVRPRCCTASQGRLRANFRNLTDDARVREATLTYKHEALLATLKSTQAPTILLDLDALILRRGCFETWLAMPGDIVVQMGGAPGCPYGEPFTTLGLGVNTGAMLVRPTAGAIALLEALVRMRGATSASAFPYVHHCHEQELLVSALLAADPIWRRFPFELSLRFGGPAKFGRTPTLSSSTAELGWLMDQRGRAADPWLHAPFVSTRTPLVVRFLNYSQWAGGPRPIKLTPRVSKNQSSPQLVFAGAGGFGYTVAKAREQQLCLFHAVALGSRREESFKRLGVWHIK